MRYLFLLIIVLIFSACDKNDLTEITDQAVFPSLFRSPCFAAATAAGYDEVVFREMESFESYTDSIRIYPYNLNCDTAEIPEIDFDKYTLIGKYTSGSGCDVKYKRTIYKDEINKRIVYEIDIKYTGLCEMLITSRNWALIPKLSESYTVEFKLRER